MATAGCAKTQDKPLLIKTSSYKVSLPSEWKDVTEVTVRDDDSVTIYYKNHTDMPIVSIAYSKTPFINSGDIGGGLVYYTESSDGRRLEFWATNYPYRFWYDVSPRTTLQNSVYAHYGDDEKIAIMELETSEKIKLDEFYSIRNESDNPYILMYGSHLRPIFEDGLEFRK